MIQRKRIFNTSRLTKEEKWENAGFTDTFIFPEVLCSSKELTKKIIEMCVPDMEIAEILNIQREVHKEVSPFARFGRLDVTARLKDGTLVLIEMQVKANGLIQKRMRYYLGLTDTKNTPKGSKGDELPKVIQITFCDYDPYGLDCYVYRFSGYEDDHPGLVFGDGVTRVIMNIRGTEGNATKEQKEFLKYLRGMATEDELSAEVDDKVTEVKYNVDVKEAYMTLEDYIDDRKKEAQAEGHAEGLAEGRAEGLAEGRAEGLAKGLTEGRLAAIRELVLRHAEKGLSIEDIAELDGITIEEAMTIIGVPAHDSES